MTSLAHSSFVARLRYRPSIGAVYRASKMRSLCLQSRAFPPRGRGLIMDKLLFKPEEAAQILGVGRSRIYDLMRAHLLLSVKIGRSRRVPAASLREYVAALSREADLRVTRRANGEGTIYPRRDGRWEGAAYVLLPSGGRARKRVYGKSRSEVFAKLAELQQKSHAGLPAISGQISLGAYLNEWLETVARHSVRPSTFYSYRLYVRDHLIPGLGKKRLTRLTPTDVRVFVTSKLSSGLAPATVKQMHAILRAALQHAMREDLVARNVAKLVVVSGGEQAEVVPLTVDEARTLLAAAKGTRLYALWAVALAIGLRRGEALGLRWLDVDLDIGELRVNQTLQRVDGRLQFVPPKSERSRRKVPLPSVTIAALQRHHEQAVAEAAARGKAVTPGDLVFTSSTGTPLEPRNVNRTFAELLKIAGLRPTRFHDLRHTCASLLLAQGVSPRVVMETLGHSAIASNDEHLRARHAAGATRGRRPHERAPQLSTLPSDVAVKQLQQLAGQACLALSAWVGPVGLEPTTRGLKVRCSAS